MIVVGSTLGGRFELQRRIGGGAMGEVYEALDRDRGELVALKTLSRADGETLLRFKREFRALQTTAHANLVALRELVSDGERWFFTMELVRGRHFLEAVDRDPRRLRALLPQVVDGLRSLHEAGLVHRDVKPSNIMVTDAQRVVILDFGLVTTTDLGKQSTEGRAIGTIDYMAPEQAVGAKVTPAADWYALGVMVYEALTGQVPHQGHPLQVMMAKQQVEAPLASGLAPAAPRELVTLCRDLLRIEPTARPDGAAITRRLGGAPRSTLSLAPRGSTMGQAPFVGRDAELAALRTSIEASRGHALVHVVVGESGIGKSELVAQACAAATAAEPRTLVLRGRCYERESVPYKALDGVVDGLAEHLRGVDPAALPALLPARPALLVRAFPAFRRVEAIASARLVAADAGEPHEQRRRVFETLRALFAAIAAAHPVVIAIDDLHWADTDSLTLLRELLRGADAPRMLVIATMRDDDDPPALAVDALDERLVGVPLRRTALGPLSVDESQALADRLGPSLAARVDVGRLAREAGGHPMFLCELLRHLDTGATTATLDDALWARVEQLDADARALLAVICVAGAPLVFDVAAAASALDATALGRAAAVLRVANLAREVQRGRGLTLEPYHDRVREAVGGRLDEAHRLALHGRLASALEQRGARDPHLLFRHFHQAGLAAQAATYAEEAAAHSHAAHAFDQAAQMWRAALELVPRDAAARRRLLLHLGEALVAGGRGADAADVYAEAAEGADRATRLSCQRHIAEQLLITGRIERGVAALAALLAEIGVDAPSTRRAVLWSLARGRLRLRLRGLGWTPRERHEISDAEVLRLDVLGVAATGLSIVDTMRGSDFQTRQLLRALTIGHQPHIARALTLEASYLAMQGAHARAGALFTRARALEAEANDPYLTALLAGASGIARYAEGDAAAAHEFLTAAVGEMRQVPGASWELASVKLFLVFNLRNVGDYRAMRQHYDQYLAEAEQRGDQYVASTMCRAATPMWLAEDDPAGARRDLERATWVPVGSEYHVQHFHALIGQVELALYERDQARMRALSDELERFAGALLMRVLSIQGQYHYARARLALAGDDLGAARRATRALARVDSRTARAWAALMDACVARRAGDPARASARLVAAKDLAVAAGMQVYAAIAALRAGEIDGDTLAARATLAVLGVVDPDKLAAAFAPR
ncbi:MAG: protein kinase [Myxococcales bacterium]|nr:protein kinase [Myxococcales bacterium]